MVRRIPFSAALLASISLFSLSAMAGAHSDDDDHLFRRMTTPRTD